MSNPLAIFRKHQKILLVVFGVALMVTFTVGGIVSQWLGTSTPKGENAPVVKLKSDPAANSMETLRESDMQSMRYTRLFLRQFMRRINGLAVQAGATPQRSLGIPDSEDERSLLQTMILSQKAEEMGLVVSDNSIINFLLRYTSNKLVPGDFERELRTISQGRMSTTQFLNAMRKEMLALRFIDLFNRGIYPATPAASWDYFQRLNRRVRIEAVPFNATQYLDRVSDPTAAEVEKLYEAGKDRYSFPSSPESGFKRRKKISLQYVKADLEPFLNEEKEKITAEAIEIYYNDNKENYRNIQLPDESDFSPGTTGSEAATSTTDEEATTDAVDDSTQPVDETTAESDATETTDGQPTDSSDATAEEETSDESLTDEDANECGPFQEESEETDQATDDDPDSDDADSDDPDSDDPDSDDADSDDADSDDPDSDDADSDDADSDDAESTADEDVEDTAEPAEDTADRESTDSEPAGDEASDPIEDPLDDILNDVEVTETDQIDLGDLPDAASSKAQAEFKALEEVADEIRTELATALAVERMEKALNAVRSKMRAYSGEYIVWEVSPDRDETPKPTPPNLQSLAAEQGLTTADIPLVDVVEIQETDPITGEARYPIAQSFDESFTPFARLAFGDDLRQYEPRSIRGQLRDLTYLYWKTDEVPEETPTLDECRDEVVRDLKMKSALSLAKKDAESAVKQLQQSNRSPLDIYRNAPDRKVIEAGPFAWMSQGSFAYMPPQISRIEGIDYPGNDFMKEVFQLQQGESGVAVNNPEDVAYLVYVKAEASNMNQLRDSFFRTGSSPEVIQLGLAESREKLREWYNDYEKKLEVEWLREAVPDSRVQ